LPTAATLGVLIPQMRTENTQNVSTHTLDIPGRMAADIGGTRDHGQAPKRGAAGEVYKSRRGLSRMRGSHREESFLCVVRAVCCATSRQPVTSSIILSSMGLGKDGRET
jgi:hypothetical protein